MKEVCAEEGWCAEQLLLPSLLVIKILSQVSTFLGRAQSRVKWIPKQHVLALVPSPFHITQLKLWC